MARKLLIAAIALFAIILALGSGFVVLLTQDYDDADLSTGEQWFDDWYTIIKIDDATFAIGEPRYWQKNYSYLILGNARAILFDTGPGVRDIRPVVNSLTSLPLTVVSSHRHYDHIGNNHRFKRVAAVAVPAWRSHVEGSVFKPTFVTGFTSRRIPPFPISEWWQPEQVLDLGGRRLKVLHIPGHADGSIALLDENRSQLFTGDFIYPGWLVGFAPSSDLDKYLESARYLLEQTSGSELLYGAHAVAEHPAPQLPYIALTDLEEGLTKIKVGELAWESRFPFRVYSINADMQLYVWYYSDLNN